MSETAPKKWSLAVAQEIKPEMETYHAHVLAVARAALTGDRAPTKDAAAVVAFAKVVVDKVLALPIHEALKTRTVPLVPPVATEITGGG